MATLFLDPTGGPGTAGSTGGFLSLVALCLALGLAATHLFAGRLRFLDVVPRSQWLSVSGGVAIAYVFVHLLPEVQEAGETIGQSGHVVARIEHHVYLVTLAGFVVFYGLEQLVRASKRDGERPAGETVSGVFHLHVGSFAVYNGLVGYLLLHREEPGVTALATFFVAMALHFVVNDYGLRQHHGAAYHRYGRWVLAGAVLVGFGVGYVTSIGELLLAVLVAFLAGGIVLNVIKEELPEERESRFWSFVAGVVGYTLLLVTM